MDRSADWFNQAKRDLSKVEHDISEKYYEWACFTAQQSSEKAVKAVYSDVDILIVVESTATPLLERKEFYSRYFPIPFDVNILVYTADEQRSMTDSGNLFLKSILQHAVEL